MYPQSLYVILSFRHLLMLWCDLDLDMCKTCSIGLIFSLHVSGTSVSTHNTIWTLGFVADPMCSWGPQHAVFSYYFPCSLWDVSSCGCSPGMQDGLAHSHRCLPFWDDTLVVGSLLARPGASVSVSEGNLFEARHRLGFMMEIHGENCKGKSASAETVGGCRPFNDRSGCC